LSDSSSDDDSDSSADDKSDSSLSESDGSSSDDNSTTSSTDDVGSIDELIGFSFDIHLPKNPKIKKTIEALDYISLFIDTDKENYCLIQNALPVVMVQTEKWIKKQRDGRFGSFAKSKKYIETNAKSKKMIPFWRNLYYQFGLIAITLEGNIRPSNVTTWEKLFVCCMTISATAQWQLYKNRNIWKQKHKNDLRTYQSNYNTTHETLKWFTDKKNNYLHVDIRSLDSILTIWIADSDDKFDKDILKKIFKVEGIKTAEIRNSIWDLVDNLSNGGHVYSNALKNICRWNWNIKRGAEKMYDTMYENVKIICETQKISPRMVYFEAVEHHRRYDSRVGTSIFWSSKSLE